MCATTSGCFERLRAGSSPAASSSSTSSPTHLALPVRDRGRGRLDGALLLHRRDHALASTAALASRRALQLERDWQVNGRHYARTLEDWLVRLDAAAGRGPEGCWRSITGRREARVLVAALAHVSHGLRRAVRLPAGRGMGRIALPLREEREPMNRRADHATGSDGRGGRGRGRVSPPPGCFSGSTTSTCTSATTTPAATPGPSPWKTGPTPAPRWTWGSSS